MVLTAGVAAPVRYGRAFFALQVELARAVAALTGRPLGQALLDYTNLYVRFGLGRAFDPAHPGWQEYVAGLDRGADLDAWTYAFYLARPEAPEPPAVIERAGCFACARTGETSFACTSRTPRRTEARRSRSTVARGGLPSALSWHLCRDRLPAARPVPAHAAVGTVPGPSRSGEDGAGVDLP